MVDIQTNKTLILSSLRIVVHVQHSAIEILIMSICLLVFTVLFHYVIQTTLSEWVLLCIIAKNPKFISLLLK